MFQESYNQFKKVISKRLCENIEKERPGSRKRQKLNEELVMYEAECKPNQKLKDAVRCSQCIDETDRNIADLNHIDCAMGFCKDCVPPQRH